MNFEEDFKYRHVEGLKNNLNFFSKIHRLPVDLYSNPVAVPASNVFISSSSPRTHCNKTPNPEYMTASVPSVFAVDDPCFMM